MSKSRGAQQTPAEPMHDLTQAPTQAPEGFGAIDMSPDRLHEQSLGNSERASRMGLGGGDKAPALSDLNLDDWMNEPEANDIERAPVPFKSELERGFGADLSGVTVRLGAREELDAQGAEATAEGETLSFASTHPDRELVAHEVAHLVQSREHGGSTSPRLSDPNEAAEQEADAAAKTVAEGGQAELEEGVSGVMRKKKGPKNNVGIRSDGEDMAARWGVAIQSKKGWIDTFELVDSQLKFFSDGSSYIGPSQSANPGQGSESVQLNHKIAIIGTSICIMAHGVHGGNFWTPLTNIKVPQDFDTTNPEDFRTALLQRVDDNNFDIDSSESSELKLKDLSKNIQRLRNLGGAWKEGWRANMADQRFVLRGCRVKHPADGSRSANQLSDYIPGVKNRPLYFSMNRPKDDVAPVVGDVLHQSTIDGLVKSKGKSKPKFHVLAECETGIWRAPWEEVRTYQNRRRALIQEEDLTQRILDDAPAHRNSLTEMLNSSTSGAEAEKYRLALVSADLHKARSSNRLVQIRAERKKLTYKQKLPKTNERAGTVAWRFIRLDKVNSRVIEGWVPYGVKL